MEPPYPAVERLVPHGPPMRLVDEIVGTVPDGIVCRTRIGDDFVFLRGDEVDIAVTIELVAQAIACYSGLRDHAEGSVPKPGLLVGCRTAKFVAPCLRRGDELLITARSQWVREPVASFTGDVTRDGEVIASVELSVVIASKETLAAALEGAGRG